jgi:hypothetical protein
MHMMSIVAVPEEFIDRETDTERMFTYSSMITPVSGGSSSAMQIICVKFRSKIAARRSAVIFFMCFNLVSV